MPNLTVLGIYEFLILIFRVPFLFLPSFHDRNALKERWLGTCPTSDLLPDWLEVSQITGNMKLGY